eukprot:8568547-Pyramimonas_sp.AAC.2
MRGVLITVEQPLNSLLYSIPSMAWCIDASRLQRVVTWMGAWGGDTMKPDAFYTNFGPHQISCIRKTFQEARENLGGAKRRKSLVVCTAKSSRKKRLGKNKMWVTGNKKMMNDSARYPVEFTSSLAKCTIDELRSRAATVSRTLLLARRRINGKRS